MSQESKPFRLQISADHMLARARELTGIDLVDEAAVEPFRILHAAYNTDACLHEQGALAIEKKLLRLLCNRLRMQRDFAKHPEIAEIEIKNPLPDKRPTIVPREGPASSAVIIMSRLVTGMTKAIKTLAVPTVSHSVNLAQ